MSADGRTAVGHRQGSCLSLRPLAPSRSAAPTACWVHGLGVRRGLDASYTELIATRSGPSGGTPTGRSPRPTAAPNSLMHSIPALLGAGHPGLRVASVSDQTPFDRFLSGDQSAMDPLAQQAWRLQRKGDCMECHVGAAPSDATGTGPDDDNPANETGFPQHGVRDLGTDPGWTTRVQDPGLRNVELTGRTSTPAAWGRCARWSTSTAARRLRQRAQPDRFQRPGEGCARRFPQEPDRSRCAEPVGSVRPPPAARPRRRADRRQRPGDEGRGGPRAGLLQGVPVTGAAGGAALPRFLEFTGRLASRRRPRARPVSTPGRP